MTTTRTPLRSSGAPRATRAGAGGEGVGRGGGEPPRAEPLADWFASPDLRAAVAPPGGRPYDRARPDIAEVVLERGRSLLLPRIDAWEAAPRFRDATGAIPG